MNLLVLFSYLVKLVFLGLFVWRPRTILTLISTITMMILTYISTFRNTNIIVIIQIIIAIVLVLHV